MNSPHPVNSIDPRPRPRVAAIVCTLAALMFALPSVIASFAAAPADPVANVSKPDPAKVVGHEACAKCHAPEVERWNGTPHHATFDLLHRTPAAKEIADRLGENSIKRNDTCVQCHYTEQLQGPRVRVTAGISCESCHGGAADWLELHADYGPGATRESESPEHRQQRLQRSIAAGMKNPANLYLIARQCYSCHTVPNERLVNLGGHRAGSTEFELVAWSQGMVRHNFVRTGGSMNATSTPERLRVMYIVGVMADLEHSLRAVAQATQKATFGVTSAQRAVVMKQRLRQIDELVDHPRIDEALDAVSTVALTLGNSNELVAAADRISTAAEVFAGQADGSQLAAIDRLLPHPSQYRDTPHP